MVLIDLLKSVGHENIIELHYLKKLLKSIVLSMPIDEKNMIKKIKYIDDYDSYSDDFSFPGDRRRFCFFAKSINLSFKFFL